ncbi:unnamed protein product [Ilex paraguariensis]|uniref:Response regulatory domain-containing protein n=1 Tax=Ilex paraguariensis TaxID=185542 RepID=A0ABC8TJL5_9AQUA
MKTDIVITDICMPDMDGFRLLEIIDLEMDIPLIMMSAYDRIDNIMRSVKHGVRDYLVKPVEMKELKNKWQQVIRKTIFDLNKLHPTSAELVGNSLPPNKRRDKLIEQEDETNILSHWESSAHKKSRVTWTADLHKKFVDALQQLEVNKVFSKKMLEIMNEPELSRGNIASHLQKYRILLNKQQARRSQERDKNTGTNRTFGHLHNGSSIALSDTQGLPVINNYGSDPGSSHAASKTLCPEQNFLPSPMSYQTPPTMPISVLGNVPQSPICLANPHPQPESNGMKFQEISQRRQMANHSEMSSHMSKFEASQSGPSSSPPSSAFAEVVFEAYCCPPAAFNLIGIDYQMLGDATTEMLPISQPADSLVGPLQASSPGHREEKSLETSNGRGGLDLCKQTTGFSCDIQGSTIDDSMGNDQMMFLPLLDNHNSYSSPDDDISIMVKQIAKMVS